MSNLINDDQVIVIEFDTNTIRIKFGIADVNTLPTLSIPCSIAIPNPQNESNELVGVNFEDVSTYDLAIIGDQLKSINLSNYKLVNPIESNQLTHLDEFKCLLYLIFVKCLRINLAQNNSALLLVLPPKFTKENLELITQFCFENLNTPGLYLINRPLATLYGHGCVSGLVLDIGERTTHINPIVDNALPEHCIVDVNVGTRDIEAYWLNLLRSDEDLKNLLGDKLNEKFIEYFRDTILVSLNEPESETEDNPSNEFNYEGIQITIKQEILDQLWNVLFVQGLHPEKSVTLQHSIFNCLQKLEHEKRPLLTDNIAFSGTFSNLPGLSSQLEQSLQLFLTLSDNAGYTQINKVSFIKLPEYFSNYKGQRQLMTILGGTIAAKGTFNDYKNYVNKYDYNKLGPKSIHAKIN